MQYISRYLYVTTTTIDFLLMLNSELDDQVLVLVGEGGEGGRGGVELSVGRSLQTFHIVPLSRFQNKGTIVVLVF